MLVVVFATLDRIFADKVVLEAQSKGIVDRFIIGGFVATLFFAFFETVYEDRLKQFTDFKSNNHASDE